MPSKHRYSPITPRLPTELKDRAQRAVGEMGTDLSALITGFLRWYVGDLTELPDRPTSGRYSKDRACSWLNADYAERSSISTQ
jgi:hypothetical protein